MPPFYTLQPNLDSRKKQLEAWRSIVLDYCQKRGLTSLDLREASNSELFNNPAIQRRLSDEALQGTEYQFSSVLSILGAVHILRKKNSW